MTGQLPPLMVISDRQQARYSLDQIAAWSFHTGLRSFMLRDRDLPMAERAALAERLAESARAHGAQLIINGDWTLAREVGAAGVHLQQPGEIPIARSRLGAAALIGLSAHSREDLVAAAAEGADYTTLSPIFLSQSKPGYGPALGLEGLRKEAASLSPPLLALGGINTTNARDCLEAGAVGVAVMGEVMRAEAPGEVVLQLLQALR
ncbi:thiamine phosphate synthase [Fodinicurvata fenggangensis]|uniref:thiamine phosphate synthase n=1 Tax=Fodinicurvata fenggangensis TaxID=1121830 RepID=UPI00047CD837|nr:thiamine phosphate synthase [Fodinicurvata fenggangensis]